MFILRVLIITVDSITIRIDTNQVYQTIVGFGGAFTDSTGWNIDQLSINTRLNLMQSYFGINGSVY